MTRWNFSSTGAEVVDTFRDRVEGKTVLLTGPSPNSIGAETALSLARASPAILILTGRSKAKLEPLISSIASISPSTVVHFVPVDLSSQSSVRKCVEDVKNLLKGGAIDILVHSAGIMVTPFEKIHGWGRDGQEGVEGQFATNYLGAFLMVNLLIPDILRGGEGKGGRVVLVSSSAHRMGGVRFGDVNFQDGKVYNEWEAYAQSKTALILFSHALARKLGPRGLHAFSLHPGSIKSNLQTNMFATPGLLEEGLSRAKAAEEKEGREWKRDPQKSLQQGCTTSLVAALDPEIEGSNGEYLVDGDIARVAPPEWASSVENQARLWRLSEELTGEGFVW
ncbi:NAD(P)-binding protein [Stipitochalara longipes BDJ]|nr:NAD(P)-binding protein [Stipitochalara longipes BDJ]